MGLDAYLYVSKSEEFGSDQDGFTVIQERIKRIASWRKHYDLHSYMQKLHGRLTADEFNCVKVYLDKDQLVQLMNGFPDDQHTFGDALVWLERGYHVYYDSWW